MPERLGEYCVRYINTAIFPVFPVLTGHQLSLRLKQMLPSKTDHVNNRHHSSGWSGTSSVGFKIHSLPPKLSKLISASQSGTLYADQGLQDRFHGTCSSIKHPGCQTHLG